MNRKLLGIPALAAVIAALALAGCGGSSSSGTETGSESASSGGGRYGKEGGEKESVKAAPNAEEGTTLVSLANVSGLGMVLVDSKGMTLYEFGKDEGTESTCYGECAKAWPPLLTEGEPQPSNGADGSMLGTTERKDGTLQVTYNGRPLYGFFGDKGPGEANGNNVDAFGAKWYALSKEGEKPEDNGGGSGGEETSGGSSYHY